MLLIRSHTTRRPKGHIIIAGDVEAAFDTLQCGHCGCHYPVDPGSGIRRGFCTSCMRPTCGHPACDKCVPYEKQLDLLDGG